MWAKKYYPEKNAWTTEKDLYKWINKLSEAKRWRKNKLVIILKKRLYELMDTYIRDTQKE